MSFPKGVIGNPVFQLFQKTGSPIESFGDDPLFARAHRRPLNADPFRYKPGVTSRQVKRRVAVAINNCEISVDISFDSTYLILASAFIMAVSGVPCILAGAVAGQRIAMLLTMLASIAGEYAAVSILFFNASTTAYSVELPQPFGEAAFTVDNLSLLFLLPLYLVVFCAAIYSPAYWPARKKRGATRLTIFTGLFAASMIAVTIARNGVLFLMAWEVMAISAYFLLTADQQNQETERSGRVYLIATHFGTMALLIMFALLCAITGTFDFPPRCSLALASPYSTAIILAALFGFGGKAGLMPMHFWLPGAHAGAPSHISAMMSGLMLKMGIYGILRVLTFFNLLPPWVGWTFLILGAWSAVGGIAVAAAQRDLKRLLACSSIENVGIIFTGIGMSLVGMQIHSQLLIICGLTGAFIHVINHSLFKSLLFMGSGVIIHGAGTREIDLLGGVARRMPVASALFLAGTIAICGFPPLNGFIGELYLYAGAIQDGISNPLPLTAVVAPLLALVGGVAAITFVKLYGIVFLGQPRSDRGAGSHEAPLQMTVPIMILAFACLFFGLYPVALVRLVSPAVISTAALSAETFDMVSSVVPLAPVMLANGLLILLGLFTGYLYLLKLKKEPCEKNSTWGCGYPARTPRMQYTGTSFSGLIVSQLGTFVSSSKVSPDMHGDLLPAKASFAYEATETVLNQILTPLFRWTGWGFSYLRRIQHGQLQVYILYIIATLFTLMLWRGR